MAPAKEVDGNDSDIQTLLTMLSSCEEFVTNNKALAEAYGIARPANALRKATTVLKKYGYKYENKRVTAINNDDSGDTTTVKTPKKTPAKSTKVNSTQAQKKRKLEAMEDSGDGDEQATGAGEGRDVEAVDDDETV